MGMLETRATERLPVFVELEVAVWCPFFVALPRGSMWAGRPELRSEVVGPLTGGRPLLLATFAGIALALR